MSLTPRLDAIQSQAQNLIINGNLDFWQRGTSLNFTSTFGYQADRFSAYKDGSFTGTSTYARVADVPTYAESGFNSTYSLRITNGNSIPSPGTNELYTIRHAIEGYDYASIHRGYARLQFWVKSSITGTFSVALRGATNRAYATTYAISAANTWEKKTIDFQTDQSGTWALDNSAGLYIAWTLGAGTGMQISPNTWTTTTNGYAASGMTQWTGTAGATFQLAQISLIPIDSGSYNNSNVEFGFKRAGKTIGEELRMCQRYYEKSYQIDVTPGTGTHNGSSGWNGGATASQVRELVIPFRVSKRIPPTSIAFWDSGLTNASRWTGIDSTGSGTGNQTGGTFGEPSEQQMRFTTGATTFPGGRVQWAVDTEL